MAIRVVVAHPEILYKQALSNALSLFNEIIVVNQARFYEELLSIIRNETPDFVVASFEIFVTEQRVVEAAEAFPHVNFILLTKRSEDALKCIKENVQSFLTFGYLVDLYRMMLLTVENRKFAQPAVIKNVLSSLRKLEESGVTTETLLLDLDQKKLSILVDIILGKSFDEICYNQKLKPDELSKEIEKIIEVMKNLIKT